MRSGSACPSCDGPANAACHAQELLSYVDGRYAQLDTINLATVLYRLATLYSFIHVPEQRAAWRKKLMEHPVFTSLLGKDCYGNCRPCRAL